MKNTFALIVLFMYSDISFSAPQDSTCGTLQSVVIEPQNPADAQLQVTIKNKVSKKSERLNVSESIRKAAETVLILQTALQNEKLEICLSHIALGLSKR